MWYLLSFEKKEKKLWSHLDWFARMLWIQFEFKPKPKVLRWARCVWTFSKFCIDAKLNNIGKWQIMLRGSRDVQVEVQQRSHTVQLMVCCSEIWIYSSCVLIVQY